MIKHSPAIQMICPKGHWAQQIYFDELPPTQCALCKALLRRQVLTISSVKVGETA